MENNELKQPLNKEQNKEQILDQSINSTCCYFDIYCGELCYLCSGVCCYLFGGVSI